MTREEFINKAKEYGYTQDEIQDLESLKKDEEKHFKVEIPYEKIPLIQHEYLTVEK